MKTNKITYLLFCVALITACGKAPNTATTNPAVALKQINEITRSQLGIRLSELTELTRISGSDIILTSESSMKPDMLANLSALQKAGYIRMSLGPASEQTGMDNVKFYKIQKTAKGQALLKAVSDL
jgi:hypothetical protein